MHFRKFLLFSHRKYCVFARFGIEYNQPIVSGEGAMEVKDILKNRRLELHMTMKELADKVGYYISLGIR